MGENAAFAPFIGVSSSAMPQREQKALYPNRVANTKLIDTGWRCQQLFGMIHQPRHHQKDCGQVGQT
jgi:hypothetical protein